MAITSADPNGLLRLQPELYLLICKFLERGPCREAADSIRRQLDLHELLPRRLDWQGDSHRTDWASFEAAHPHIGGDFLPRIVSRVASLLNQQIPSSVFCATSLLGAGSQSLLRTSSGLSSLTRSSARSSSAELIRY